MISFMLKLGVVCVVVVAASSGYTFNLETIENETLRSIATAWNFVSTKINQFVADNDEEIIAAGKALITGVANIAADAFALAVEFVKARNETA